MEEKREFIKYGLYENRYGYISIFVGEHPDSGGRIRPYFVELRKEFKSNDEVMKYLKKVDINKLTETVLGEAIDCHYAYDYGYLGVIQEPVLSKFKKRIDYVFGLPFKNNGL